jgi:outer membrane protein assembly factor BamE (lipoprotein component of BamABCDE complex)
VKRWRALFLLLIVLTLALLVHALIVRVRSSPLFIAEEKFAQIQVGMSRAEVCEIMGSNTPSFGPLIDWSMNARRETWYWFWKIQEKQCRLAVEFKSIPFGEPDANCGVLGKQMQLDLDWLERIEAYLSH